MNRVTVDFGADINNELSRRKRDISVRKAFILCSSSDNLTPEAHTVMYSTGTHIAVVNVAPHFVTT